MQQVFDTHNYDFFYTNDVWVFVDILLRRLEDMPFASPVRFFTLPCDECVLIRAGRTD